MKKIIKLLFIIILSLILLRIIWFIVIAENELIIIENKSEAIKNEVFLGDYIPMKKYLKSRSGLDIPLSDGALFQNMIKEKKWYLLKKLRKARNTQVFKIESLHDSLLGSKKRLHLTDNPNELGYYSQVIESFNKKGEMVFDNEHRFIFWFNDEAIPDTIMIYLIEKDENYEFYPTPSDSVAYIRVKE